MKKSFLIAGLFLFVLGLTFTSCKKDEEEEEPELTGLDKAKKDYEDEYLGTKLSTISWTGSEAGCDQGDVASETRDKVVKRVNYYRAMCGLPSISLNSSQNSSCQRAALMMMANNDLNHTPPNSWTCFVQEGYDASSTGNIAIGWGSSEPEANHSINAVSGYMEDPGPGNEVVGHRAWLLCRKLSAIGTGSVYDADHEYQGMHGAAANCIRWGDNLNGSATAGPEFITYPPATYVPSTLVFPRWHFSYPNANFSAASVSMKDSKGKTYTCNIIHRASQGGGLDARIVWEPQNVVINEDLDFTVTVSDISGAPKTSYEYTVKAFHVTGTAKRIDPNTTNQSKKLFL